MEKPSHWVKFLNNILFLIGQNSLIGQNEHMEEEVLMLMERESKAAIFTDQMSIACLNLNKLR